MSADWETPGESAPRWRRLAKPAAVVVAGAVAVGFALSGGDELSGSLVVEASETPTVVAASEGPVLPVAPGDWQTMAGGPLSPRQDVAVAWTGTEMLVWGGRVRDRLATMDDGAAYEPLGDRWRVLPQAPLSPRGSPAAAWTGAELVVWGGAGDQQGIGRRGSPVEGVPLDDGAAYNPATNRWRPLPQSPLSPRRDAVAVALGDRVLVWGGTEYLGGPHFTDGAIYDPDSDTWTLLPEGPLEGREDTDLDVVRVGDTVFMFSSTFQGIATARYDTAAESWGSGFGALPLRGDVPAAVVGLEDSVVVWGQAPTPGGSAMAFRYSPAEQEWRTVDRPPRPPSRRDALTAAGYRAVAWEPEQGLIFDSATDRWATMPEAPPLRPGTAEQIWTGDRLLVWHSGGSADDPSRAAAWVPGDTW